MKYMPLEPLMGTSVGFLSTQADVQSTPARTRVSYVIVLGDTFGSEKHLADEWDAQLHFLRSIGNQDDGGRHRSVGVDTSGCASAGCRSCWLDLLPNLTGWIPVVGLTGSIARKIHR